MSMYNLVHGTNPLAGMILAMLGMEPKDIPRFRDAYYDGEHLCVYTRTGGGNRDYYDEPNDDNPEGPHNSNLRASPYYVADADDDYDCTYATFTFNVPEKFAWFKDWAANKMERPASERWAEAIEHFSTAAADDPLVKRVMDALAPLVDAIGKGESGIVKI